MVAAKLKTAAAIAVAAEAAVAAAERTAARERKKGEEAQNTCFEAVKSSLLAQYKTFALAHRHSSDISDALAEGLVKEERDAVLGEVERATRGSSSSQSQEEKEVLKHRQEGQARVRRLYKRLVRVVYGATGVSMVSGKSEGERNKEGCKGVIPRKSKGVS